jgi:hypothetical protein
LRRGEVAKNDRALAAPSLQVAMDMAVARVLWSSGKGVSMSRLLLGGLLVVAALQRAVAADPSSAIADPDKAPAQQAVAAAEPQRRGLPAPLDSPPFPGSDWPLGGSQLIGVPDTAVGPLMKWIYDTPQGQAWKDSRVKVYGWAELGANASSSTASNAPGGYAIRPDRLELEQFVVRVERLPDTVQQDHVDWGFNITGLYGLDYRYTIMKGIFSDQLLKRNQIYGYDIPTFYGDLYFPQVADGLNVRFGRYLSIPDIESQLAPANYLFTHSPKWESWAR